MSDANHKPGMVCSRYYCNARGAIDTEMGMMCAEHASPLLFEVQMPRLGNHRDPMFVPWEFVRPHERQARANHSGQTLARLSERGGLSPCELIAVLCDRGWRRVDHGEAVAEVLRLLDLWRAKPPDSPRP